MAEAADLHTYIDAAISAMGSGDWATARLKLLQAQAVLIAMPDAQQGQERLEWRANQQRVSDLLKQVNAEITDASVAADGIRTTKVTYKNATVTDDYC